MTSTEGTACPRFVIEGLRTPCPDILPSTWRGGRAAEGARLL